MGADPEEIRNSWTELDFWGEADFCLLGALLEDPVASVSEHRRGIDERVVERGPPKREAVSRHRLPGAGREDLKISHRGTSTDFSVFLVAVSMEPEPGRQDRDQDDRGGGRGELESLSTSILLGKLPRLLQQAVRHSSLQIPGALEERHLIQATGAVRDVESDTAPGLIRKPPIGKSRKLVFVGTSRDSSHLDSLTRTKDFPFLVPGPA